MEKYAILFFEGADIMRRKTMLSAFQEQNPKELVEYIPKMAHVSTTEWQGQHGIVECEVGITKELEVNQIDKRMRRYHLIEDTPTKKTKKHIDVLVKICTSLDNSTETICILPSELVGDRYWYISFSFTYDAKKKSSEKYLFTGHVGMHGGGAEPVSAEVYALVKIIASDMCNPNISYDTSKIIELLTLLDNQFINETFLLGWYSFKELQNKYNVHNKTP